MTTMVKNEDTYIRQWIEFHRQFGITRFCIYDNANSPDTRYHSKETKSNLVELLRDFIEKQIVIIIIWPYPKFLKETGVSGQTTQQTHAIHSFNCARYLGLFDVDEYLNPQHTETNIGKILDDIISYKKETRETISGVFLNSRTFYNLHKAGESGYNFLNISDCTRILLYQYRKCFVIPKNVSIFCVHMPSVAKPCIADIHTVSCRIIFNHYFFLNKPSRGRAHKGPLYVDTSIRRHFTASDTL
jgi:hypothetical protein